MTVASDQPITVLLVDDSLVVLTILERILSSVSDIKVVGKARSGREALTMIPKLNPAVVCTDLMMPDIDGLELTRKIVELYPRPILVISSAAGDENRQNVFQLLEAGALDVMAKPVGITESDYDQIAREIISKIKIIAGVYVFRRRPVGKAAPVSPAVGVVSRESTVARPGKSTSTGLVVVGASTGGPQVLGEIFTKLPADYRLPVVCVQHIALGFLEGLVAWLNVTSPLKVVVAEHGRVPAPGTIYLPPEDRHLMFDSTGAFRVTSDPLSQGHRPSIDVTMKSAAAAYGSSAVGVLLSGMGRDGAQGMQAIASAGGITIAQDQSSCIIFGMPKQAIDIGAAQHIMNPREITGKLTRIAQDRG